MHSPFGTPGLPGEIWIEISTFVPDLADVASLARTSSAVHSFVSPALYKRAKSSDRLSKRALLWGLVHQLPRSVHAALNAGIDPNLTFYGENRFIPKTIPSSDSSVPLEAETTPVSSLQPAPNDDFAFFLHESKRTPPGPETDARLEFSYPPHWHWCAIHVATFMGDLKMMELLLKFNASLTAGCMGLCDCIASPRTILRGDDLNMSEEPTRWTPLHLAICMGNASAAELLLSNDASFAMEAAPQSFHRAPPPPMNITAFHTVCISGKVEMLEWLMKQLGPVAYDMMQSVDYHSQSPAVLAYLYENWQCFDYLIGKGVDIDAHVRVSPHFGASYMEKNHTLLYQAVWDMRFADATRLLEMGANPFVAIQPRTWPLLFLLLQRTYKKDEVQVFQLFERLLEMGMDPNEVDGGKSLLDVAAGMSKLTAVRCLLKAGANVDGHSTEPRFTSPLGYACENSQEPILETVNALLDAGASVGQDDHLEAAPLWILSKGNIVDEDKMEVMKLLLKRGASPARGTSGRYTCYETPLECLLKGGHLDAFDKMLAECKPDALGGDDMIGLWRVACGSLKRQLFNKVLDLDTGCYIAQHEPGALSRMTTRRPLQADVVLRLLEMGALPKAPKSELTAAISNWANPEIVEKLLDKGANPNPRDSPLTPLLSLLRYYDPQTSKEARTQVLTLLLRAGASIYEPVPQSMCFGYPRQVPQTHLGIAIWETNWRPDATEMMLESQPIDSRSDAETLAYIHAAAMVGHSKALRVMIRTCPALTMTMQNLAPELIHVLLDEIYSHQLSVGVALRTIDCLKLFIEDFDVDLSGFIPADSTAFQTAKEKILNILAVPFNSNRILEASIAWCFRSQMRFTANDVKPEFTVTDERITKLDENMDLSNIEMTLQMMDR